MRHAKKKNDLESITCTLEKEKTGTETAYENTQTSD